jgi:hypothetical protein
MASRLTTPLRVVCFGRLAIRPAQLTSKALKVKIAQYQGIFDTRSTILNVNKIGKAG